MRQLYVACTVLLLLLNALPGAARAQETLRDIRDDLGVSVDGGAISVSGVSSGGYMAGQYHLAHSTKLIGAGIIAGGPYACARTTSFWCDFAPGWPGFWMPHDSCQAIHMCTAAARLEYGLMGAYFGPPDHRDALDTAVDEALAGRIDPLSGLKGDRVWLFSGLEDSLMRQEITDDLRDFYLELYSQDEVDNPPSLLAYEDGWTVEHGMVVDIPGEADRCLEYGPPFINDCGFDAAGQLLAFIHDLKGPAGGPPGKPAYGAWDGGSLRAFDQRPFFDAGDDSVSLNTQGHIYVPDACRDGVPCPLHIAFHGCRQHEAAVRQACENGGNCPLLFFHEDGGYNEWAEAYGIVVLYPQATAWGDASALDKNPRGCWDWWGYSGDGYFRKSAKQIQAVDAMIACLRGTAPCG
ncbi:hypothetical protein [Ferruginivarius sediminum]|uniref:Poly(3-hydroxybutyrate) depolymerase n=1 Tax=Ferruginivarius sediminum TaxID=2661937 RepID=A0A369THX4_9PROT|nr:hypothetical protein [Ferruginivarius sediminum]RDD63717.1 hypothetical protein DRB17_00610 [Ferruginivarius sediminum]